MKQPKIGTYIGKRLMSNEYNDGAIVLMHRDYLGCVVRNLVFTDYM